MAYVTQNSGTSTWNPNYNFNPAMMPYSGAANPTYGTPAYTGSDIAKQWTNNRNRAIAGGEALGQQIGDQTAGYAQNEAAYGGLVPSLYSTIWSGGGGYTPEQMSNVLQTEGLNQLAPTSEQTAALQMTDAERGAASGNPYAWYDPSSTNAIVNNAEGASWGQFGQGSTGLLDTANTMQRDLSNAANTPALNMSGDYGTSQQGLVDRTSGTLRDIYQSPSLNINADYAQKGALTDREVQQLAEQAGADVGMQAGRQADSIRARAAAAGMNPMGAEALVAEQARPMAASAADAMTRARLEGRQAQISSLAGLSGAEQAAAQYRAGLGTGVEQGQQTAGLGVTRDVENTRLGTAQDIATRQAQAAAVGGQAGINTRQNLLNTELGLTNTNATRALGNEQWNQQQGTAAENTAANRAYQLATNRQSAEQQGQENTFNRGMGVNQAASTRYQQAYAPYLSQQQEGRQAAQNMLGYYGGQYNTGTSNRIKTYQAENEAAQGASQGAGQWEGINKNAPGWFAKNIAPMASAATGAYSAYKKG